MQRQKDTTRNVLRQSSAPELVEKVIPSFKEASGFAYHATGFEPVAPNTSSIMQQTEGFLDMDAPGTLCDDPRFGNFALRPAHPTCVLTTRPRHAGTVEGTTASPPEISGSSVDFMEEYM
jgi:hypothetical protein